MREAKDIFDLVVKSNRIVITSHRSPDGDSIGSSVAMYHFLNKLNKDVIICHPDPSPTFLDWVKRDVELITFEEDEEMVREKMLSADLIFCLDYNGSNRMGYDMGLLLDECIGKKVMIDHHPHPEEFVDIPVTQTDVCSTCQLVYEFIVSAGQHSLLDASIGTPIYLGIMTDTGSFRYSSVTYRTHEIIADLIKRGVEHTLIHEDTFDNVKIDRLKLRGYAIANKLEVIPEFKVAYISLTEKELLEYNYEKGDTDGLVNTALSVEGVNVAAMFTEKDGQIKISFRSKGIIPVNRLAIDNFDGGGHVNAAGGASQLSMVETIAKFRSLLPEYFKHA